MANDIWTAAHVKSLAPDAASIPAAEKVLKKGGFGTVEATADGRGWWVVCRGLTGTYQVTVRREAGHTGDYDCTCNCLSYKNPCKHALALLLYLVEHPELRAEVEAPKAAASDFEALLRGAFREPADDTPRLVFADFLEENDQPDRAALIRYQCERARLKPQAARYKELTKLINPLLARLRKEIEPLPEGMEYEFVRGFVHLDADLNRFDVGSFPSRLTKLFRDGWIESLVRYIPQRRSDDVKELVAQVGELDMSLYHLTDDVLVGLVSATAEPRANGRLLRMKVHSRNRKALTALLRAERGEAIDPSAELEPVRRYQNLDAPTFRQLLQFGRFGGARDLTLDCSAPLGEAELSALLAIDLSNLRHLRLYGWALPRTLLAQLADSPALAKLATLQLRACGVQGGGVSAIVTRALFAALKELDLSWNNIGKAGVEALMRVDVPAKLKNLVLIGCSVTTNDRRRLKAKYRARVQV